MTHQGQEAVDEYRNLAQQADSLRAKLEAAKARIRGLLERVSELEGGARKAKRRYQQALPKHVAGNMAEEVARGAKQDLGSAEGDLAEAKGVLQALQTDLPKLNGEIPRAAALETARRAAWEAIWQDLQAQVPKEVPHLLARIYVALMAARPDAPYSAALMTIFPDPPRKQECGRLLEQLAKEYGIPP